MKKALSFILALTLIVSLVPSVVFAEDTATETYSLTINFAHKNNTALVKEEVDGEVADQVKTVAADGSYITTDVTTYKTHKVTVKTGYDAEGNLTEKVNNKANPNTTTAYRSSSVKPQTETSWNTVYDECSGYYSAQTRIYDEALQIVTGKALWADDQQSKWTIEIDMSGANAGYYNLDITPGTFYVGGNWYVYAQEQYAGLISCAVTGTDAVGKGEKKRLNTLYLEPDENGKVKITFALAKLGYSKTDGTGTYSEGRLLLNSLSLAYLGAESDYGYTVSHDVPAEMDYTTDAAGVQFTAYADAGDGIARAMNGINSDGTTEGADSFAVEIVEGDSVELTKTITDGVCTGTLVPKKLGDTTLKFTATINGDTYTDTKTVSVTSDIPLPVAVDFTTADIASENTTAKIYGDNFTTIEAESSSTTEKIKLQTTKDGTNVSLLEVNTRYGSNQTWLQLGDANQLAHPDTKWTIEVPIAAKGWYKLKLQGGNWYPCGTYFVYVNDTYAGNYCFDGGDSIALGEEKELNTLYLTPDANDKVKISFAFAKRSATAYWIGRMLLKSLTLTPVADLDKVEFKEFSETLPDTMNVGETVDFKVSAMMNDGSVRRSNGYTATAAEDAGNYTTVSVKSGTASLTKTSEDIYDDGVYAGELTATTPGDIVLTMTSCIDGGTPVSQDITVTVPYTDGSEAAQKEIAYIVRGSESKFNAGINMTGYTAGEVGSHPLNTSFTAVADEEITVDNIKYNFAYWQTAGGTPIEDAGASYTFTPKSNFTLEAVYIPAEPTDADKKVQFWNYNRAFIGEQGVKDDGTVETIPDEPTLAGHTFTGWAAENIGAFGADTQLTAALTRVVAQFTADADKYSVKIDGTEKGKYAYGELFEATADATKDEQVFSHWAVGDTIVSYDAEIKFYVWNDIELTAVYADAAPEAVPTVMLDNIGDEYFIAYRMPTGYTPIDAGIVFGSSDPRVDSTDGSKASVREVKAKGQFTAQPNTEAAYAVARGYIIYKVDATGDIRVLYTK